MRSWYIWSPLCTIVMIQKVWHELNFAQVRIDDTDGQLYVYTQLSQVEIETPTHWNLIGRSVTTLLPGTVAQQYSSTTFVLLWFHSCKEKLGTHFKNIILSFLISLFYFLSIMKFCKSWSACIGSDTSLMCSNQAPHVDLLWKYKLNPKCNKSMAVLACYFNYCMLYE